MSVYVLFFFKKITVIVELRWKSRSHLPCVFVSVQKKRKKISFDMKMHFCFSTTSLSKRNSATSVMQNKVYRQILTPGLFNVPPV